MKPLLQNTLPILAAAYGNQFGVNVRIGGDRAYTDGQNIQIPLIEDPALRDVVLAYLVHESAHLRFTDFGIKKKSKIQHHLRNIFEDVRIERGMYEGEYPGTFNQLKALADYVICVQEALPDASNPARLLANYTLLRSLYLQYQTDLLKQRFEQYQQVAETVFPEGFFIRMDILFDKYFDSMASTLDAHNFAIAVLKALKDAEEEEKERQEQEQQQQEQQQDQQQQQDGQGSSDSDTDSNESGDSSDASGSGTGSDSDPQTDQDSSDSNGQNQNGTDQDSDQSEQDSDTDSGNQAGNGAKSLTEQILSEKDLPEDMMKQVAEALGEAAEKDVQENQNQGVHFDSNLGQEVNNTTWERGDSGADTGSLKDGLLHSSKLRSQLVSLLQSQTKARNSHREYGNRFDGRRIARAMAGESRVWKHKEQKKMVDTSVHILLDSSGSMGGHEQEVANNATLSLAMAISQLPKADVAVSIFPGISSSVSPLIKRKVPVRAKVESFAVPSSGGTPMAEAMFYAARELSIVSSKNRKVLIVITDGAPNNGSSVQYINNLVEDEIDVYAIGIGTDAVRNYFKNNIVINRVEELQTALFGLTKKFFKVA